MLTEDMSMRDDIVIQPPLILQLLIKNKIAKYMVKIGIKT